MEEKEQQETFHSISERLRSTVARLATEWVLDQPRLRCMCNSSGISTLLGCLKPGRGGLRCMFCLHGDEWLRERDGKPCFGFATREPGTLFFAFDVDTDRRVRLTLDDLFPEEERSKPWLEVGERKPETGPFRAAVKLAGYESEENVGGEWVHVGDDWGSDCVGAKAMRMRTILVRVPGSPSQTQTDDLDEEDDEDSKSLDDVDDNGDGDDDDGYVGAGRVGAAWRLEKARQKTALAVEKLTLDLEGVVVTEASLADKEDAASRGQQELGGIGGKQGSKERRPRELGEEKVQGGSISDGSGEDEAALPRGGSSYLTDMIMMDFMDAEADTISDVVDIVDRWNQKYEAAAARLRISVQRQEIASSRERATDVATGPAATAAAAAAAAAAANPAGLGLGLAGSGDGETGGRASAARGTEADAPVAIKFCINCGETIPVVANFCPACGTKQVEL